MKHPRPRSKIPLCAAFFGLVVALPFARGVEPLNPQSQSQASCQAQADAITAKAEFGPLWVQSQDRGTTAWFETRFSVPQALGWLRTGDAKAKRLQFAPEFVASGAALSDNGKQALVVADSATETQWQWVDLVKGKVTARRTFAKGSLFNPIFSANGQTALALQRVAKSDAPIPASAVAKSPITSTPEAVKLGLVESSSAETAVLSGNDYVNKFILAKLDQSPFRVVEVPMNDGAIHEIGPEMAGGYATDMLRSPDGSRVLIMVIGPKGTTFSLLNAATGAVIRLEPPEGFNMGQSTFLRDGRLLLKDGKGFTLLTSDGAQPLQIPLPEMNGGGSVPKEVAPLRPNYTRNPLAANRPVEIGGNVYFLANNVIAQIDLRAEPLTAKILLAKSKTILTSLYAVGDRFVVDQWDGAAGTTGLAEIGMDGSVKPLLTEKALIFAVGSTQDQVLAVRQSGDAPTELLALNPAHPEAKPTFVTALNPALQGLAMGTLERIGGHVLLRPSVPPPSAAGYPVVVFAYPNAKPEETPLAFDTGFGNLPRRLALRGIASLFAHVTVKPTDNPDSDLSQELTDGTLRAVDAAVATGGLDGKRLGFMGWSYGGHMAYCLATRTDRFSAFVSGAGYIDPLLSYAGLGDQAMVLGDQTTQGGLGGPPWKFQERYLKTGPLWRIEAITAPILIVAGGDDKRVPPSEGEQAFRLLRRANKAAVLAVYPGGDHSLDRWPEAQQLALANRVEAWFQKTLAGGK